MDWNIVKNSRLCSPCGMGFKEREKFFSALYEDGDRFFRKDVCLNCWNRFSKEGVFSFWKSRLYERDMPVKPRPDTRVILELFLRLESEMHDGSKINLRYLLALYLMRKKTLRFKTTLMREGIEYLLLYHPEGGREIMVSIPKLSADAMTHITDEVRILLGDPIVNEINRLT